MTLTPAPQPRLVAFCSYCLLFRLSQTSTTARRSNNALMRTGLSCSHGRMIIGRRNTWHPRRARCARRGAPIVRRRLRLRSAPAQHRPTSGTSPPPPSAGCALPQSWDAAGRITPSVMPPEGTDVSDSPPVVPPVDGRALSERGRAPSCLRLDRLRGVDLILSSSAHSSVGNPAPSTAASRADIRPSDRNLDGRSV